MPKSRTEQEVYSRNAGLYYQAEYSGGNVLYEGWAVLTGSAIQDSNAVFQICKHTHDGNGNLTKTEWAQNSDSFEFAWSLRATYF